MNGCDVAETSEALAPDQDPTGAAKSRKKPQKKAPEQGKAKGKNPDGAATSGRVGATQAYLDAPEQKSNSSQKTGTSKAKGKTGASKAKGEGTKAEDGKSEGAKAKGENRKGEGKASSNKSEEARLEGKGERKSPPRSRRSSRRAIEGASAQESDSMDLRILDRHINFAPCPEEHMHFVQTSSLECLVYWKLQGLIDALPPEALSDLKLKIYEKVMSHVERPLFALVLRKTSGNLSTAAKVLGCNRNTIHRKLTRFEIMPRQLRLFLRNKDETPDIEG